MKLAYSGDKEGLLKYLKSIVVCERCGSFDGVIHHRENPVKDEFDWWSICDICQDELN